MSIRRMTAVWELSQQKGSGILCMLAIADNANDDGLAWPEVATVARKTRLSPRHVARLITHCCDAGELLRFSRADEGRSNFYILLLGLEIPQLIAALRKLIAMSGYDILSGVYPEAWAAILSTDGGGDILSGGAQNLNGLPPELTWGLDIARSGGGDNLSGGYDTAMSNEPSLSVIESSGNMSGGSAAEPPDARPTDWLGHSRIPEGAPSVLTNGSVASLTVEERAAIASPVFEHGPEQAATEPIWAALLRRARGRTYRYPHPVSTEDVVAVIERFCQYSGVDPPATEATMRAWHAGAVKYVVECISHLPEEYQLEAGTRRRAVLWCLDLFFHERSPVGFITATTPHSLISSVPLLVGHLKKIVLANHRSLAPGQLPTEAAIVRFYDDQAATKRHGGTDAVWKQASDSERAVIAARLYPAENGIEQRDAEPHSLPDLPGPALGAPGPAP